MNPFDLMKNAKEIQEKVSNLKNELENEFVEGESGGGLVKVKMKGTFELVSISLDPIAVDNRDVPMLEDLIISAHSNAVTKLKALLQEKLGPLASGLPL